MLKTTIVYKTEQSISVNAIPGGHSGFRTIITVTEASNITPSIFVMQRKFLTSSGESAEDRFYTVASVADLENLPDTPSSEESFYRTNVCDLIYRNREDQTLYTEKILTMIARLINANDLTINLEPPVTSAIPESGIWRYWGQSTLATLTDEELQAMDAEPAYSLSSSKTFTTEGPRYLYFAYETEMGEGTFTLDGASVDMTLVTRVFTNADGHARSYRIYRTTNLQNGTDLVLAVS